MKSPPIFLSFSKGQPTSARNSSACAFSLVEIAMAIGILSFALLICLGLFGALVHRHSDVKDQREVVASLSALEGFLKKEVGFSDLLTAAQSGQVLEFSFVQFRADGTGAPKVDGEQICSAWFSQDNPPSSDHDASRAGRWVKARVTADPELNPDFTGTTFSADALSQVVLRVAFYAVPSKDQPISVNQAPLQTIHVGVSR